MREELHVGRPNVGCVEEAIKEFRCILESKWLTNDGEYVRRFETALADYMGVENVIAISNATTGLQMALMALKCTGEVIVPAWTHMSTASAVKWIGLTPVFADVTKSHHLDLDNLPITRHTTAIMPVHIWGRLAPHERIQSVANEYGLKVIYDAAMAFGSGSGGLGNCEVFSFHATKVFNTFEGGAIATNDGMLAEKLREIRNFGMVDGFGRTLGINAKMSEIQAAMGLVNLTHLPGFIFENAITYKRYQEHMDILEHPQHSNYHYIVTETEGRDWKMERLRSMGILARKYFWPGLHRTWTFWDPVRLPVTERLADTTLVLPGGPDVRDVERIAEIVLS